MAKIMLGGNAAMISGSIGGDVYAHGRHGYYIRRRVVPTKVVNAYTSEVRNILTACSRAWGGLTDAQRGSWNTWAQSHPITDRLGQKQVLFGAGAYTQLNARILKAGDTPIALPPVSAAPSPLLTFTAAPEVATQTCELTFTATPLAATERLWVRAAIVTNPGVKYFANLMKNVEVEALATVTGADIGPDLVARFGALIEDQQLHIEGQVYESTSGMLSGSIYHTIAVVA